MKSRPTLKESISISLWIVEPIANTLLVQTDRQFIYQVTLPTVSVCSGYNNNLGIFMKNMKEYILLVAE